MTQPLPSPAFRRHRFNLVSGLTLALIAPFLTGVACLWTGQVYDDAYQQAHPESALTGVGTALSFFACIIVTIFSGVIYLLFGMRTSKRAWVVVSSVLTGLALIPGLLALSAVTDYASVGGWVPGTVSLVLLAAAVAAQWVTPPTIADGS